MSILAMNITGCEYSSKSNFDDRTYIIIGYGYNSYNARISDEEEIKQLKDLYDKAEFDESDISIQQPYLRVVFHEKNSSISFYIDDNDVIQLGDGGYKKSKQINFDKFYSIYKKHQSEKK